MRLVPALLLACVVSVALAAPAHAACDEIRRETRWQPDPFGMTGGSLAYVPVCRADDAPRAKPKRAKPKPTRAQLRALRYRPSEAVSAKVRARMIEHLAQGPQAEEIRAFIDSGDLMRQFNGSMRTQRWSRRDLGDMYSLAYIQLWLVANDKPSTTGKVDEAVRRDLRAQLALDRKVRRAKDKVQQEAAEWLGSWTVVLGGSINHLRTLGDPALVDEFRAHARELIAAPDLLGVDLTRIRLTRHGIARRG
jgi:hypothetical protein